MGETEYTIFLIIASLILLVFISGIVIFILQYYKRKLSHEQEKKILEERHIYELLAAKLEIQQHTMQHIGQEIHDNIGQKLTLAAIYLNQLSYENRNYPERIATVGNIVQESLQELRNLSKNLAGAYTDEMQLNDLVKNECDRIRALGVCAISCRFNEAHIQVPAAIKNFILRIIQEFLQNSLKHAQCTAIELLFDHTPGGLRILASDNGSGFPVGLQTDNKGLGLASMRKRAELIGAAFSLTSTAGAGTALNLFIPTEKLLPL